MTEQDLIEIESELKHSEIPKASQEKILDACEKQVVKKAKMRHCKPYDSYNDGWCSCCEAYVNEEQHGEYCPKCGQKIDWSD